MFVMLQIRFSTLDNFMWKEVRSSSERSTPYHPLVIDHLKPIEITFQGLDCRIFWRSKANAFKRRALLFILQANHQ